MLGLWLGRIGFGSGVAGAGVCFGLVRLGEVNEDAGLLPRGKMGRRGTSGLGGQGVQTGRRQG